MEALNQIVNLSEFNHPGVMMALKITLKNLFLAIIIVIKILKLDKLSRCVSFSYILIENW